MEYRNSMSGMRSEARDCREGRKPRAPSIARQRSSRRTSRDEHRRGLLCAAERSVSDRSEERSGKCMILLFGICEI